ncbi:hypothetical protein DY000_02034369 [Brassica cretica]|uniref:No apical meristem-associated C-terminal domain-containing protein n=1 Tax=Brassica cretica TaxID=69181 RepID=A0ABQ7DJM1_BRACR|nr:hypothetical protein DY000_02034369 [Brassica cretica]
MMISPDGSDDDDHSSSVSLSRRLTSMMNHFISFSGPEVRWTDQETKVPQTRRLQLQYSGIAFEGTTRPTGVKAAKARGKNPMGVAKDMSQFQTMWTIKQQDLAALKEKISKMRLLDSLIAKQDPLADWL